MTANECLFLHCEMLQDLLLQCPTIQELVNPYLVGEEELDNHVICMAEKGVCFPLIHIIEMDHEYDSSGTDTKSNQRRIAVSFNVYVPTSAGSTKGQQLTWLKKRASTLICEILEKQGKGNSNVIDNSTHICLIDPHFKQPTCVAFDSSCRLWIDPETSEEIALEEVQQFAKLPLWLFQFEFGVPGVCL